MPQRLFALLLAASLSAPISQPSVDEGVRRVQAHLLIDDAASALQEAEALFDRHPDSSEAARALIEALAAGGLSEEALAEWHRLSLKEPNLLANRQLLEEIAWGILKKEISSTQYAVRLAALTGAYLTRDVRAIPILLKMLRDSNAVIRCVAVRMAAGYADAPLKEELERMMAQERVWIVRMEVIQAVGQLRMQSMVPTLKALVQSEKTMAEERRASIEALIHICDGVDPEEIRKLSKSNRAGLRHLACAIATHFEVSEVQSDILGLLSDTNPDVRVAALNALGLFYRHVMGPDEIKGRLKPRLEENHSQVAVTAAWAAMLVDPSMGTPVFKKWMGDELAENRRFAAAALASTGSCGVSLATVVLKESADPYVRANVALGLIGQRREVGACSDCLYHFLTTEKRPWMWDDRMNPLFQTLGPSQVRHIDQIPNYPEAIDQMTRLSLAALLAIVEDPRAIEALKSFLALKKWHITGVAAAMLLQEGDESCLEIVRELLDESDPKVRLQACLVLGMYGKDVSVLKELQGAYAGADFEMKLHILEALGSVGNPETFGFLMSVFSEPFPLLRVAAAAALVQSLNR